MKQAIARARVLVCAAILTGMATAGCGNNSSTGSVTQKDKENWAATPPPGFNASGPAGPPAAGATPTTTTAPPGPAAATTK
jgi:hypothetical protein